MGVAQKIYDWFKGIKTPSWLKNILQAIQDILVSTLLQIGKAYLDQIKGKIIEVNNLNIPNQEKFKLVVLFVKSLGLGLKDAVINLLVEALVNKLKNEKAI